MKPKISLILIVLIAAGLACTFNPAPAEPTIDEIAVATSVAATTAAQLTLNAPAPTNTTPAATDTPDPNTIYAPDPLGPAYTGLIWDFGTCYDFDAYMPAAAEDPATDACLNASGVITPQNGALMSGQAPMEAPSKGYCINPSLLPDPIAPNSDLYLCLQTNQGVYGFFVMRQYQIDLNRLTFDMYLFP